jgi:hypothetical protein
MAGFKLPKELLHVGFRELRERTRGNRLPEGKGSCPSESTVFPVGATDGNKRRGSFIPAALGTCGEQGFDRPGVFSSPLAVVVTLGLHYLHGGPWFSRISTIFLQDHYTATAAVGC